MFDLVVVSVFREGPLGSQLNELRDPGVVPIGDQMSTVATKLWALGGATVTVPAQMLVNGAGELHEYTQPKNVYVRIG